MAKNVESITHAPNTETHERTDFFAPLHPVQPEEVVQPNGRIHLPPFLSGLPVIWKKSNPNEYSPYHQDESLQKPPFKVKGPVKNPHAPLRLPRLVDIKRSHEIDVHVVIPTLDEGTKYITDNQGNVTQVVKSSVATTIENLLPLVNHGLVDDITVYDSGSEDDTQARVEERGVRFVNTSEILEEYNLKYRRGSILRRRLEKLGLVDPVEIRGKGANLWAATIMHPDNNDLLIFVDADFGARDSQVHGIISPLIAHNNTDLSLAMFRRFTQQGNTNTNANRVQGGRVTRLTWRPVLEEYFPEVIGLLDPIAGNYGVRSSFTRTIAFPTGYGIETAIVVNGVLRGRKAVSQVFAGEKSQVGQNAEQLGKMSSVIVNESIHQAQQHKRIKTRGWQKDRIVHGVYDITPDNTAIAEIRRMHVDRLPAPEKLLA